MMKILNSIQNKIAMKLKLALLYYSEIEWFRENAEIV